VEGRGYKQHTVDSPFGCEAGRPFGILVRIGARRFQDDRIGRDIPAFEKVPHSGSLPEVLITPREGPPTDNDHRSFPGVVQAGGVPDPIGSVA
jgi:hypothetical protein